MTMRAMVVSPEATGKNRKLMQFCIRDSDSKKTYGPLLIQPTPVYFSTEIGSEIAEKREFPALLSYIKSEKIDAECELADGYIKGTKTIVLRGKDKRMQDILSEFHRLWFKPFSVTNKFRYAFNWPCQEVEISDELADCIKKQDELNNTLRKIDDDYLMPLKMNEIEHNKAVSWLMGNRANKSIRSKVDSIVGNLREQATADNNAAQKNCETLDSLLKTISKENSAAIKHDDVLGASMQIESGAGIKFLGKQGNLEDYIDGSCGSCSFDIEVKHWWTDKPTVYLVSIVSDKGDFVGGEFDIGKDCIETALGRKAKYVCFHNDEKALIKWAGDKIRELDPLVVVTQNGTNYDYENLARRGSLFRIGCGNQTPKDMAQLRGAMSRKVNGKQVPRMKHPSAIDLDLFLFVQNHLGFAMPDFKLETLASLAHKFFGAKIGYTKSHTYEQQKIDVEIAQTDKEIAYGLARYGYEDSVAQYEAGKSLLRISKNLARAAGCELFTAFNQNKRKVAAFTENKQHYKKYNKPGEYEGPKTNSAIKPAGDFSVAASESSSDSSSDDGEKSAENSIDINKFKAELYWGGIAQKPAKGMFSNVFVGYLPLYNSLPNLAKEQKKKLLEFAANATSSLEQIIYHRMADEFMAAPLTRILTKNDYKIQRKYGVDSHTQLEGMIKSWVESAGKMLGANKIINISDGLLFVQQTEPDSLKKMIDAGIIAPWETADIISVGKSKVIYKMHDELLSTKIDIPSVKRWHECDAPTHYDPNIKVKAMREFIDNVFADKSKALCALDSYAKQLASGSLPAIDYLRKIDCKQLPENMDDEVQERRRAKVIEKFNLKINDSVVFGVVDKGDGSGEEDYVRYDPLTKTFEKPFVPFARLYQDEIFGVNKKGTRSALWQIASASCLGGMNVYSKEYKAKRDLLMNLMYGRGTEEEIKSLALVQL